MNYTLAFDSPATFRPGKIGFSREAVFIDKEEKFLSERFLETISFGERNRRIFSQFKSSISDYVIPDWDGYGALPVSTMTCTKALLFLSSLPVSVRLPDISADPDGAITMEWYRSPEWIFSLSINRDGKLDYAAIFGDKKEHGSMYFNDEVDRDILTHIGRI